MLVWLLCTGINREIIFTIRKPFQRDKNGKYKADEVT